MAGPRRLGRAPEFPDPDEEQLVDATVEAALYNGWLAYHCRPAMNRSGKWSTAMQGNPGFPDLVLAHRDVGVIFREFKRDASCSLTPDQRDWALALAAAPRLEDFGLARWEKVAGVEETDRLIGALAAGRARFAR